VVEGEPDVLAADGGGVPQGAGHENLEGLRRDDHHGVGWDWTSEHGNWQRR
jgi:hypothetical protein